MNESDAGVAVVTGAGSGLGAAMVDRFAGAGLAIVALDIDGDRAEQTARTVRDNGGKAIAMRVDVADAAQVQAASDLAAQTYGACTVLCANVGVQQFGAIDRVPEADWRWVLDVNVMGVVHTMQSFLPLLRAAQGRRSIVITSSSAALTPGVRMGAYTASKYAVTGLAETLRMELADEGISVSILFPAGMSTRHLESSLQARPADLGAAEIRREDIDAMMASRNMDAATHVATAEHATRHLLRDLANDEPYIFTHDDYRAELIARHEALLAAHDRGQT